MAITHILQQWARLYYLQLPFTLLPNKIGKYANLPVKVFNPLKCITFTMGVGNFVKLQICAW